MNSHNLTSIEVKYLKNTILMPLCEWMLKGCSAKNPARGVIETKTLCFLEKKR